MSFICPALKGDSLGATWPCAFNGVSTGSSSTRPGAFFNNIDVSCAARSRVLNDDSSIVARPGVINGDSRGRPRLFNKTSILFRSQLMAIIAQKAMAKHKT